MAIIVLDEYLKATQANWRAPVLAVAVGIYLPLELATAILLGGLIAFCAQRRNRASGTDSVVAQRNGMLFASGLITGEALIGIGMAVPIVLSGNPDIITLGLELPTIVGLLVIAALSTMLYRVATK